MELALESPLPTVYYCYLLALTCFPLFTAVYMHMHDVFKCYLLLLTAIYCYLLLSTAVYCRGGGRRWSRRRRALGHRMLLLFVAVGCHVLSFTPLSPFTVTYCNLLPFTALTVAAGGAGVGGSLDTES